MQTKRVHLLVNSGSGKGTGASIPELVKAACVQHHFELKVYEIKNPKELDSQANLAITSAETGNEIVMIAGGDGSVRSVAEKAAGKSVQFAVIPCGTFNFFARTHKVPEEAALAIEAALTGEIKKVRLGSVNTRVFLVNASMGLYAKSIVNREQHTARFGRNRIVVILSTLYSLFSKHKLLDVAYCTGKKEKQFHTPMIFIGNNALQLRNLSIPIVRCLGDDLLALVVMKPIQKSDMLRLVFRGIFKFWENEDRLQSFCVESATIRSKRPTHLVALDGEVFHLKSPLTIKALPEALNLLVNESLAQATPEVPE